MDSKMSKYTCDLCKKVFNQKVDFTRHQNKKAPCITLSEMQQISQTNISKMDNKTTLIIVSSPIPTHPNTDLVDEAIESVMTMNYNFEDIIISYDCPPNKKHIASYEKYKNPIKWSSLKDI